MATTEIYPYTVMEKEFDNLDDERVCRELGIKIVYTKYGGFCFQEFHHIATGISVTRIHGIHELKEVIDWLMREVDKHNEKEEALNDE